jgi:hypothetical protein
MHESLPEMKLLQIGASWLSYKFSGLERYYTELITRIPSLGWEVIAIAYELQEAPDVNGLKLVSFGTLDFGQSGCQWELDFGHSEEAGG